MMIKYKKIALIAACLLSLNSCNDFLDPLPTDKYSEKVVWQSEENANLYVNGFYTYINLFGNFGNGNFGGWLTDGLTDMLKYGSNAAGEGNANLYAYEPTRITPDQNSLGVWGDTYDRIRRVNEFLEGLEKYSTFSNEVNDNFRAQGRFFRAYLYFQLVIRHKSVILFEKTTQQKDNPRSSEEECWDFIERDLDYAINTLPIVRNNNDYGRLTKGAALAFKSRAMLFAKRWAKAKEAAEAVINLTDNGALVYELNSNYKDAFKTYRNGNKESVLEASYADPFPSHSFDKNYAPGGDYTDMGGKAAPTQEMVEEYELATGGKADWAKWHGGTNETPPYALLEPRFHASVLYNGASWKGRKIESYIGGKDGFMIFGADNYPKGKTTTGYFLKKYLDESNRDLATKPSTQAWIEIRLAEVYLNLAEAAYELNDNAAANQAIRTVRARVSLPYSSDLSGKALLEAIRHERKVELAFEGRYYWDLRRWGIATTVLNNKRFHGLQISKNGDQYTYEYVSCDNQDRIFLNSVQNSFPIPSAELANNLAITQLDDWK